MDVAARARRLFAVQEMPDPLPHAQPGTAQRELPAGHVIGQEQQQERPQIRGIPFVFEGSPSAKPTSTGDQEAPQAGGVMDDEARPAGTRIRPGETQGADRRGG